MVWYDCIRRVDEVFSQRSTGNDESLDRFLLASCCLSAFCFLSSIPLPYSATGRLTPLTRSHPHCNSLHLPTWKVPEAFLLLEARFPSTRPRTGFAIKFPTTTEQEVNYENTSSPRPRTISRNTSTFMKNSHVSQHGRAQYPKCSTARARVDASHLPR